MINTFRKIRKNLADDDKPLKYARYAIGEIILVVFGILIALQINNWNEDRKERKQETAILKQLRVEFESNLKQLDEKITSKRELINSALQLFKYIDEPSLRDKDSIDYHLGRTIPYSTFDPIVNDLASSGNLRLIRNDTLKQLLSFWTTEIIQVQEDDGSWKNYRNVSYVPYLVSHYQLRTIRTKATRSNVLGKYLIEDENEKGSDITRDIGMTSHPEDFNALLDQPDFEDHLERCYTTNKFANSQSLILRKRIVEIIDILNKEIKRG
jgi:hypothetical protein